MDTAVYIVTSLCLAYMVALVAVFVYKIVTYNREGRLKYLKGFKKGKFSLVYFVTIPLYYIGIRYSGSSVGGAILKAIKSSVETVVLKFGYDNISALMDVNPFFKGVTGLCFALIVVNAVIFITAFTGERVYNRIKKRSIDLFATEVYVVIGYGKNTRSVIKSIKGKRNVILVADKADDAVRDFAYAQRIAVIERSKDRGIKDLLAGTLKGIDGKVVNVIVDTGADSDNLKITDELSRIILSLDYKKYAVESKRGLYVYVFGDPSNASSFYHYEKKTNGCVRCVNKYKLLATDFVGKHPLTEYMTDEQIDYSTGTLRAETDINVVLIGFGKTSKQIFLTSVANNQFLTLRDGKLSDLPVNYFIYDREAADNDKNLNHDFFRFANAYDDMVADKDSYLPIPEPPARHTFFKLDINDGKFYSSLRGNLSSCGKQAYNYVVVCYGTDMENLDLAEKISEKLVEWQLQNNTKLFVKIRDDALSRDIVDKEYASTSGYITFGAEAQTVYNIDRIVAEENEIMARFRHMCYAFEYRGEGESEADILARARNEWFTEWQQVQREANVYACLSIKSKLQLLGFDLSKDPSAVDASGEYLSKYSAGDPIIYTGESVKGKKIVDYGDCNFTEGTVRNIFAVQEHARWNAYEISCGYLPATIEEIVNRSKKELIAMRKHRNITTYEGLYDYRRLMAKVTGKSEAETDVIKYDYQLMDDLVWLLHSNGYKIVQRANSEDNR